MDRITKDITNYLVEKLDSECGFCGMGSKKNVTYIVARDDEGGEIEIAITVTKKKQENKLKGKDECE